MLNSATHFFLILVKSVQYHGELGVVVGMMAQGIGKKQDVFGNIFSWTNFIAGKNVTQALGHKRSRKEADKTRAKK